MPEAVIVSTARTPIGRAFKGSLIEMRPDDLAAVAVKAALAKVPNLDPATVEDLMIGCAQPAGEHGYNMGRVVSLLSGLNSPGTTVNRYCSSSLQTIRMAAHAIKAGEGKTTLGDLNLETTMLRNYFAWANKGGGKAPAKKSE